MGKLKHVEAEQPFDNRYARRVYKRLNKLLFKWTDLLGEKKRTRDGPKVINGKEGEIGPQLGAFNYMFNKLTYGDRSKYGEKSDEFYSFADMLEKFLESIKRKAEEELHKFNERSAQKGIFGRINDWLFKILMQKPGSPNWYEQVIDTAGKTIVEIEEAVRIIKQKFGAEGRSNL